MSHEIMEDFGNETRNLRPQGYFKNALRTVSWGIGALKKSPRNYRRIFHISFNSDFSPASYEFFNMDFNTAIYIRRDKDFFLIIRLNTLLFNYVVERLLEFQIKNVPR